MNATKLSREVCPHGLRPSGCDRCAELDILLSEMKRLREYINGLLGLIDLLSMRDDLPTGIRDAMLKNHRYIDAFSYVMTHREFHERPD